MEKINTEGEQKHTRRSPLCIIHVLCNLPLVPLNCLHDKQAPGADEKEINLTQYPVHEAKPVSKHPCLLQAMQSLDFWNRLVATRGFSFIWNALKISPGNITCSSVSIIVYF